MVCANWRLKDAPFSGHCLPILLYLLQSDILISKCSACTAVMRTVVPHMTLFFLPQFIFTCFGHAVSEIRASQPLRSLPCSRSECCPFGEGCLRDLVQLVIRDGYLSGDDSIAYDHSSLEHPSSLTELLYCFTLPDCFSLCSNAILF